MASPSPISRAGAFFGTDAVRDGFDQLRRGGIVGHGADHAVAGRKQRQPDQGVEPAGGDHGVVVEQADVLAVGFLEGLLAGGAMFGFVGILVAVPVSAVIGVLSRFFMGRYVSRETN